MSTSCLFIPNEHRTDGVIGDGLLVESLRVAEAQANTCMQFGFRGIIGMDVLNTCSITFNGLGAAFTLTY
jgi:hypothetical protein